jgi:ACS family tartrate transporter-like MFS transporter
MLAAVLFITAAATYLYGRKIQAGIVPPLTEEELRAKELAAQDVHRGDPSGKPVNPETTP